MKNKHILLLFVFISMFFTFSCNKNSSKEEIFDVIPKTPVTVCLPTDTIELNDEVVLNATSTYLLKSDIKANSNGYITRVNIKLDDYVKQGQKLFGLQTKESKALGNTISNLDPTLKSSGFINVISPASGYIEMLAHQTGDYVQEGDILARVTDESSFGFVMDMPYEYNQLIKPDNILNVKLPDNKEIKGRVSKIMPTVDIVAQTQKVLIKVEKGIKIPENLIATIKLVKKKTKGISLPKASVLANEGQTSFWVMKMINDTTAVKVMIKKGIETKDRVQVVEGDITTNDRIILSGNFGLSDTSYVQIKK